jgi:hypothetical protein
MPFTAKYTSVGCLWSCVKLLTFWVIEAPQRLDQLWFLRRSFWFLRSYRLGVDGAQSCGGRYFGFPLICESSKRGAMRRSPLRESLLSCHTTSVCISRESRQFVPRSSRGIRCEWGRSTCSGRKCVLMDLISQSGEFWRPTANWFLNELLLRISRRR